MPQIAVDPLTPIWPALFGALLIAVAFLAVLLWWVMKPKQPEQPKPVVPKTDAEAAWSEADNRQKQAEEQREVARALRSAASATHNMVYATQGKIFARREMQQADDRLRDLQEEEHLAVMGEPTGMPYESPVLPSTPPPAPVA